MDFPTLSILPTGDLEEAPSDAEKSADVRISTDSGHVVTRKRFTRVPDVYRFQYWPLGDADYNLLKAFVAQVGLSGNFNWTHPVTSVVHDVRFLKRPTFVFRGLHWRATIELEEV